LKDWPKMPRFHQSELPSEEDIGSYPEYRFILDPLRWHIRVHNARARVEHVLKIRLDLPPRCYLILVGHFDEGFAAADRGEGAGVVRGIPVQSRNPAADVGIAHADTERVVVAMQERLMERNACVEAEVDEVAISQPRSHPPDEDVQGP